MLKTPNRVERIKTCVENQLRCPVEGQRDILDLRYNDNLGGRIIPRQDLFLSKITSNNRLLKGHDMNYKIDEIEGIGPVYTEKLSAVGITTTEQLLEKCASAAGRNAIEKESDLTAKQLLVWADVADLMRVNGVGRQFGELLKAAGVDTIKELATRRTDHLTEKLAEINAEKRLAQKVPSETQVQAWIAAAKETTPMISH
jgi:predicted flap endonuclease-1-like 5' DNA nuclease